MTLPVNPVNALTQIQKDRRQGAIARWQERNRLRRDEKRPSKYIFFTHHYLLGMDEQTALYAAQNPELSNYVGGTAGIIAFPFLGGPMLAIKFIKRAHSFIWYGE